jgi:hypothetical protein
MKKILCVLVCVIFMCVMVGCAKLVDTKTETVKATIVDIDRDPMMLIGKIVHPADYDICLEYNNGEYWIDITSGEYYQYENLVGAAIDVDLVTHYYDDDTTRQYLELKGE